MAAPLARFVPIPALSAVLVMVAWNMGEWKEVRQIVRLPKSDITVWATTFALTVLFDLTVAVEIGMLLAAILFIKRIADTTSITAADPTDAGEDRRTLVGKQIPEGVNVYRVTGPLLFGAADRLDEAIPAVTPPVVIVKLRDVPAIDATGLHALEQLADRLQAQGTTLILCDARPQPLRTLWKSGVREHLGRQNLCLTIESALRRAETLVASTRLPGEQEVHLESTTTPA